MSTDEKRLRAELPELLDLLENVAGYIGSLDLAKVRDIPAGALADLNDSLLRALDLLHELFAFRGATPPAPEPGIAYGALGPSLKRTLPQRLAAQLDDELNALPGRRPEDVSEFAALGLFARVVDLLRFVAFLRELQVAAARSTAPATLMSTRRPRPSAPKSSPRPPPPASPPPASPPPRAPEPVPVRAAAPGPAAAAAPPRSPTGPGPDLSAYSIRIDEAGERVESGNATVWIASDAGPRAAGEGLAASFAVGFPGGVAFAVAEGVESSLGARLSSVVAVRAFCRSAAANPSSPETAVRTAQHHLDMLLSALLSAGDATDAFTRVRGSIPPANARRILEHTREPEEALRRVTPALSTSFVGAVAVPAGSGCRVSIVRLGPGRAEARVSGRVTSVLEGPRERAVHLLGPGARGIEDVCRTDSAAPVSLSPGDALLLGTPALARGATSGWDGLKALWPSFPEGLSTGEAARDLLRRARLWGETEPPQFAGPLGLALLLVR
jgi:hypothetical protein